MLKRYSRKVMADIWSLENKFQTMLKVEKAAACVQGEMGLIPKKAALAIQKKAGFSLKRIQKNELSTRHDVTAFVNEAARTVGRPFGSYVHWGLTSSDVLDTAFALQIREAGGVLNLSFAQLEKALLVQAKQHADVLCVGRTHGMWAEPITFGLKLAGFLLELNRHKQRVQAAVKQVEYGKISGAVGAYHVLPSALEKKVCAQLKLRFEPLSTQVIPRDRHAEVILSLACLAGGLERLAVEIRHLQKQETGEVSEEFVKGQTGSSAMPHKKNPIYCENITGLCRMVRSYAGPCLENIALWHERDISHSSVERVMFPSAFILCDFALVRLGGVVRNLHVNPKRMAENLRSTGGQWGSSLLLAELVRAGMRRSEGYNLLQSLSVFSQAKNKSFQTQVMHSKKVLRYLSQKKLSQIFSLPLVQKRLSARVRRLLKTTL